jgi:hypothetical protein
VQQVLKITLHFYTLHEKYLLCLVSERNRPVLENCITSQQNSQLLTVPISALFWVVKSAEIECQKRTVNRKPISCQS